MEFINLKAQYADLKEEIDANISRVINSAQFILGDIEKEFEKKIAEFVGVKHAIGCGNGTDALQLIYMAYGIGRGDAVFCPDMTFIASIEPALMLGAYPVLCDIDPVSYNLSPEDLERRIKETINDGIYTPKAVVAVDFVGNPANHRRISEIADKYGLLVIEDAAQSVGASIAGKKCGSFGDICATSFFPSKPLGCYGDGGAVFTNSDEIDELLRSLRVHGKGIDKYHNVRVGLNSRLDTIQAAVLLPKLGNLDSEIEKRQILAKRYDKKLGGRFVTPAIDPEYKSSYAQYVLLAEDTSERDEYMKRLKDNSIPTLAYYPVPLHEMDIFARYGYSIGDESLSNATSYAYRTFSIPFSAYITQEEQDRVAEVLLG